MLKKCSVFFSASYFQFVNQSSLDAYDISLSDCTPYLLIILNSLPPQLQLSLEV